VVRWIGPGLTRMSPLYLRRNHFNEVTQKHLPSDAADRESLCFLLVLATAAADLVLVRSNAQPLHAKVSTSYT
jgi:hypothetical protein